MLTAAWGHERATRWLSTPRSARPKPPSRARMEQSSWSRPSTSTLRSCDRLRERDSRAADGADVAGRRRAGRGAGVLMLGMIGTIFHEGLRGWDMRLHPCQGGMDIEKGLDAGGWYEIDTPWAITSFKYEENETEKRALTCLAIKAGRHFHCGMVSLFLGNPSPSTTLTIREVLCAISPAQVPNVEATRRYPTHRPLRDD